MMAHSVSSFFGGLVARKRPEPSYPTLPLVHDSGESSVRGIYLIGEVGGIPLIKLALTQGVEVLERLHKELDPGPEDDAELLDVLIVGAGSSGLGAAMRAHELGMRYQVLESERIAMTVVNMYKGKVLFAEPEALPNRSSLWFQECTREELLERWRAQVEQAGLRVNEHEKVVDIQKKGEHFVVKSSRSEYRARRVLLSVGKAGNPRKAGVPGESDFADKLFHGLSDPDAHEDRRVFVYGGGDVAAEAALALCARNQVTMVTIDPELTFPRKRNVDALKAEQSAGRLDLQLASKLVRFDRDTVTYRNAEEREVTIPNDVIFQMIGAELPLPFFRRVGIGLEGDWHPRRWAYLALVATFVYSLYALKKFPEQPYSWPFYHFLPEQGFKEVVAGIFRVAFLPFAWLFEPEAYSEILRTSWFQQGYLYSLAYTIVMVVFGYVALQRWSNGIARDNVATRSGATRRSSRSRSCSF